MIRATPNSVRWDEINRVKYKFQAFNLPPDLLENLVLSSPPLARRERASTSPEKVLPTSENSLESSSRTPTFKSLANGHKSASLDDASGESGPAPKRKFSVVEPPSLKDANSRTRQPVARLDVRNRFDEKLELEELDSAIVDPVSTSTPEENKYPSSSIRIVRTVAEPSRLSTIESDEEGCSKVRKTDSNSALNDKATLPGQFRRDELEEKSKEELIQMIMEMQRRSSSPLSSPSVESRETQTLSGTEERQERPPDVPKEMTSKFEKSPCYSNQLDVLQTEVQQVYNVSSIFNRELASVQARLGSLILKSESLTQGFKIMTKESQVGLSSMKLEKRISLETMHPLGTVHSDC